MVKELELERPTIANGGRAEAFAEFSDAQFSNASKYAEWKIRAELGIYPATHPVSLYAQKALEKVGGAPDEDKPTITVFKGKPNAFVFPNGSVYLSDQLLALAGSQEEILFVLMHERMHHMEEHAKKLQDRIENPEASFRSIMGQARIHEWEGDLKAFLALDEIGVNPMGGINIMEKFKESEGSSGGLVHGKSVDRALNLRTLTYVKDLSSIEKPLHPIPIEIKEAVGAEQSERKFDSPYSVLMKADRILYSAASRHINNMSLDQAVVCLEGVRQKYTHYKRNESGPFQTYEDLIPVVSKRIWEGLHERAQENGIQLSALETTMLFHLVCNMVSGQEVTPYGQDDLIFSRKAPSVRVTVSGTGEQVRWDEAKFSLGEQIYGQDDLKDFMQLLDPQLFRTLGLNVNYDPSDLAKTVSRIVIDRFVFEDPNGTDIHGLVQFYSDLAEKIYRLYDFEGTEPQDKGDIFASSISIARLKLKIGDVDLLQEELEKMNLLDLVDEKIERRKRGTEERVIEDRILDIFDKYSRKHARGRSTNRSDLYQINAENKRMSALVEETESELEGVLKEIEFSSPEDILGFLAKLRKVMVEEPELWKDHESSEDEWNQMLSKFFRNHAALVGITNPLHREIFDLKMSLLLAHDINSEIVLPGSKEKNIFSDENMDLETYRVLYRLLHENNFLGKKIGVDVDSPTIEFSLARSEWEGIFKEGKHFLLLRYTQTLSKEEFGSARGFNK